MSRKTRKLMWSVPLIAAVAVIGALAAFMTLQPNEAAAQTGSGMELPGMVQNLMVKAYEDGTPQEELEVTWDAPTDGGFVTSYRIDISDDGKRWVSYITDHLDSDTSFIYGDDAGEMLLAKQTKHFRVFAFNDHGVGPGYDASGATSASHKPERPTALTATDGTAAALTDVGLDGDQDETELGFDVNGDGDAEDETATAVLEFVNRTIIRLSWEAPDDPPGAPVTGYRVEYSRDGNRWGHLADTGKAAASYYHTGLRADSEFQYRIYAMNSVGRSTVSDGTTGNTAESAAPVAPTVPVIGLSPVATDVHLKWTAPADPAGDPVTHYRIQARTAGSETADDDMWMPLHAGKHISVTNVYNFGGRDLTRAKIEYPATIPTTGDNTTSLVVIDIRIAAINRANTDDTDAEIAAASPSGWLQMDDVPVGHQDAPKKAGTPGVKHDQSQHQGRSGLDVTWPKATFIANQGPADDAAFNTAVTYVLVVDGMELAAALAHGPSDTAGTALAMGGDTTKPGYDDDGLKTDTERMYQVYAKNSGVTAGTLDIRGFPSGVGKGKTARPTLPGRPTDLTVTADGHTEIKLMWTAPDSGAQTPDPCTTDPDAGDNAVVSNDGDGSECGATVITGYKIEISETGTSGWHTLEASQKESPYIAKMLTPGERYHFRVAALNSRGKGQYSEVKSEETHEAGEPTPPGGLVAQAMGRNAVKLCWYEQNLVDPLTGDARLDEGLPVLGYKITASYMDADGMTQTMTVKEDTGSKDTEYTVMDLMPGTEYTFMVHSITLGGVGMKSAMAMATTDPAVAPGMPTALSATAASDMQIDLSWRAPTDNGGAEIMGYVLDRKSGDGEFMTIAATDAASWWNALDCPMMNDAVEGHVGDGPAIGPDDMTSPYCALYAGLSDAAEAVVDRAFAASGYATITGTSHMDMGLMEMTMYTYQVKAVNSAGASMASAEDSATTMATAPDAPLSVTDSDANAGTITIMWQEIAGAVEYHAIAYNRGTGDLDLKVGMPGTARETTFTGLPEGAYAIGLIGEMADGTEELVLLTPPFSLETPPPQLP